MDWDWTQMDAQCKPATAQPGAPSGMLAGVQTALDVLGLVPVVGELADAANAALYLAQGRYGEAALSAASMIPIAGNVVGAAKLARRGAKVLEKARGLIKVKQARPLSAILSGGSIRNVNKVGGKMNCANCSIAVDAISAGRPASALNSKGPVFLSELEKFYAAKFKHNLSAKQIENLVSQPGQRGIVFGNRGLDKNGVPIVEHFFNVVNQKGTIRFLDGQTGKAADLSDGFINFSLLKTK